MEKNLNKNYSVYLTSKYSFITFFSKLIKIIFSWLNKPSTNRKITISLIILSFILSIVTFLVFSNSLPYIETTPVIAMITLSTDVVLLFALCYKVIRKIVQTWIERKKGSVGAKISTKFILTFALLVLIPTITLATFSSLFFNIGMKSWFNDRILHLAEQSNTIAEAYLEEHNKNIKNNAISISKEIDRNFNTIFLDLNKLNVYINSQIELRELTEAFIFKKSGALLAKGGFTITTTPDLITEYELIEAESGKVILTSKRKDRIRALVKLQNIQNTYLSIGKFVDPQIISQLQYVKNESIFYKNLFKQRQKIEANFYMVFILISLLILLISILVGLLFADTLINPITNLIKTANKIKSGNLSVKVPQISTKDEMSLLIKTFNEMTEKLKSQRIELQKRERNAAWLDIARRIAHEIKNPLTPIQLSAEYLKSKFKNKEDQSYANTIIKKVSLIESMVDEFTKFAKLPNPKFANIKLNTLCYDLILFHRKSNKEINFTFTDLNKDFFVKIDELQISMAISNLIKNSIESINDKETKNKRFNGKINISIYLKKDNVYVKIEDNGGGLPKNLPRNKILEPYITTKKKGTGLGLSIVLKIIQGHDGSFYINDTKNGTSALIELPKKTIH